MLYKRSLILICIFLLAGCGSWPASEAHKKPLKVELNYTYELIDQKEEKIVSLDTQDKGISFLIKIKDGNDISDLKQGQDIQKLIDYFLVGLTVPNRYLWVNLHPQEPERITESSLGQTEVGKILLEADLRLKKDACQLMNPKYSKKGREFWNRLYEEVEKMVPRGKMEIPSFTRLWIVPGEVLVYDDGKRIAILKAKLRVCLESEYRSAQEVLFNSNRRLQEIQSISEKLMRELILPQLIKKVNSHPNYTDLRKVFYSLILAECYKQRYRQRSVLRFLVDRQDMYGLEIKQAWQPLQTWQNYVTSYEKGEYSFYEETYDPFSMQRTARYYFAGGIDFTNIYIQRVNDETQAKIDLSEDEKLVICNLKIPEQGERPWLLAKIDLETLPYMAQAQILLQDAFDQQTIQFVLRRKEEDLVILRYVPIERLPLVREDIKTKEFERRIQFCLASQI